MLKYRPCSHLDLILPSIKGNVRQQQQKQKRQHDVHSKARTFKPGDYVLLRNFSKTAESHWLPGVIKELSGTNAYRILLDLDSNVV